MAVFGPTKDELISELAIILELEGEKAPEPQTEYNDVHLAALLKKPQVNIVYQEEYHGSGINIYKYRIVGDEDIHPCLAEERLRVVLDDGSGIALDTSINPRDLLYFRRGRWIRKAHHLYVVTNFK